MKTHITANPCNECGRRSCSAGIRINSKGERDCVPTFVCPGSQLARPGFSLLELALAHPQGLINTELLLRNSRPRLTLRITDYLNPQKGALNDQQRIR